MRTSLAAVLFLILGPWAIHAPAADAPKITWQKIPLDDKFLSEAVTVADFNNDGKLDIAAGPILFIAPDWKSHAIVQPLPEFDPRKSFSESFYNTSEDLNHDGWLDLIVVDFPAKETWWFENPKEVDKPWPKHMLTETTNNESPGYHDLFGDGKKQMLMAVAPREQFDGPKRRMAFLTPDDDLAKPWVIHPISTMGAPNTKRFSHGLGVGDLNGDGRKDVVVIQGWYEQPADRTQTEWKFHPFDPAPGEGKAVGEDCSQMHVYDFDGDGDMDIFSSSAHNTGIWWHEQTPEGWKIHEVSRACSHTHSLCMADINSDGLPDFVTGRRFSSKGADPKAALLWFELSRKDGKPVWTEHQIDDQAGVGTAFEVADVDGDGFLDVVTSNKRGSCWFKQVRE